jgi:Ca-activated chloride channel family protein
MIEVNSPDLVAPGITTKSNYLPVLEGVQVINTVNGFVMTSVTRQTYRNDSTEEIEITYTFPLSSDAVLTQLSVEINGKTLNAKVLPKNTAERDYEAAIESGDTPVMVQAAKHGLYNANIGNILPGEQLVVELHVAQALQQVDGTFRIRIPTVISSNYGDPEIDSGLEPHQTPINHVLTEHPFVVEMRITGALAKGTVSSPSHNINAYSEGLQRIIRLTDKAFLDRDFILLINPDERARASALVNTHNKRHMGLVSFTPEFTSNENRALNLKVLVDCSGSMGGERIEQAKAALTELMLHLNADDRLSLTVFGSEARHLISTLTPCTDQMIRRTLQSIHSIDADLGGTEMHDALDKTYAIEGMAKPRVGCDVLLITDGDIWNIDAVVASAIASDHRIFAMGVGSAPGESLLTNLASQTGGMCDLLSQREDMTSAVIRLFKRMRQGQAIDVDINWGSKPLWQSKLPKLVAPGETIHVFCELKKQPTATPTVHWQAGTSSQTETLDAIASCDAVAPLAASQRIKETTSAKKRESLALEFQLTSDTTNLLLIYEREEEKKATGQPILKQIMQMLPKGWGATSYEDVSASASLSFTTSTHMASCDSAPRVWHSKRTNAADRINALSSGGMEDFEIPAFLVKQTGHHVVAHDIDPMLKETAQTDAEKPYKLLTTLIGAILSGQSLEPQLIGRNKALMRIWTKCQEDAETPDQAFAIFILALEMLLHPNLAATSGKSIPTSQLNKVRKYGDVKNETPVQARYQELKQAFPTVTLHRW